MSVTRDEFDALTARVAHLEELAGVAPPPEPPVTYTVAQGDTLSAIAEWFALDVADLAAWNGIADPNLIRVGQVLRLSPPEPEPPQPAGPQPPTGLRAVVGDDRTVLLTWDAPAS